MSLLLSDNILRPTDDAHSQSLLTRCKTNVYRFQSQTDLSVFEAWCPRGERPVASFARGLALALFATYGVELVGWPPTVREALAI